MSITSFLSRFTSKAGTVATQGQGPIVNAFQIINGKEYEQNASPINLIKLNTGWVSVCNSKNSGTCASLPLKLYYKNNGKKIEVTSYKTLNSKQALSICKSAKIELKQEEEIEEIIEHPLLDLFKKINSTMNYYDWCELNFEYLGLIGNSYNEIIYDANGLPIELIPLLSEYVVPIATGKTQGDITGYIYKPAQIEYRYKPEEILHFAQYAPGNMLIGKGDLETCLSAQERYMYYDQFEKFLGLNNSRPDFAVNYKNRLNEKDMKDLYREWNKRFGGVQNSGKVAVTSGEMEIKTLSLSPRELQYQQGRQWSRDEICASFGIPISLVTTTDVNRANAVAGMNQYLRNTIYPKMVKYCCKINEHLTPLYDENLFVWFSEQYLEDPVEKNKGAIEAYNAGVISKNECREVFGYEAVDGGNMEDEVEPVEEDVEDINNDSKSNT